MNQKACVAMVLLMKGSSNRLLSSQHPKEVVDVNKPHKIATTRCTALSCRFMSNVGDDFFLLVAQPTNRRRFHSCSTRDMFTITCHLLMKGLTEYLHHILTATTNGTLRLGPFYNLCLQLFPLQDTWILNFFTYYLAMTQHYPRTYGPL